MDFEALNKKILPPDAQAEKAAWAHWDGIAKPLRGLGRLEEAVVRIAALTGSEEVELEKRAVLVLCGPSLASTKQNQAGFPCLPRHLPLNHENLTEDHQDSCGKAYHIP